VTLMRGANAAAMESCCVQTLSASLQCSRSSIAALPAASLASRARVLLLTTAGRLRRLSQCVHAGVGLAHPQKPAPMRMFKIDLLAPLKQSPIRRRQLMQPVHNSAYTDREKPPLLRLQPNR
jgi:hypothetical protein